MATKYCREECHLLISTSSRGCIPGIKTDIFFTSGGTLINLAQMPIVCLGSLRDRGGADRSASLILILGHWIFDLIAGVGRIGVPHQTVCLNRSHSIEAFAKPEQGVADALY
jgi:hypothetical protein